MTVVLKLGGSVITRKDRSESLDEGNLARATDAIARFQGDLVLVHGGGSFGHHHADKHGVTRTRGTHDARAVLDIHLAMNRLNDAVLARLHERGVPALPMHPLSAGYRDDDEGLSLPTTQLEVMLENGFVPVLHGDVIGHRDRGATIVSGDELVAAVGDALSASRIGLCAGVPGVFDGEGNVIPEIGAYDEAAAALEGSDATDVTGGMAAKVKTLLAVGRPAWIFGLDDLPAFLEGESPGTQIG